MWDQLFSGFSGEKLISLFFSRAMFPPDRKTVTVRNGVHSISADGLSALFSSPGQPNPGIKSTL